MYCKIKARNDSFMVARHPLLSFSSVIMNCCDLMIIQPIYILLFVSTSNLFTVESMYLSINILSDIRFILFGFFFLARIWVLHYDYQFGKQCVSLLWRTNNKKGNNNNNGQEIPKKGIINKFCHNFYLQHRQTWGNPRRIVIVTLIATFLCLTVLDILPFIWGQLNEITYLELNDYIRIPIYFILGVLLFTVYRKVKSIDDKFKIRLEIVCIGLIPGVLALIYMIFEIIITLPQFRNQYQINPCSFFYIYAYFMLLIVTFSLLIETILPLKLDTNQSQSVQHTLNLMKHGQSGKDVSFGDILGSAQGLLLFVEHLETEFSVENILFIVFIAKYREHYMSKIIPTLLSKHESILQKRNRSHNNDNVALNSDADDMEYSTTGEMSGFKTIINITPKQTPRKVFRFEKKRFDEDQKTDHELSPAPDTPEPPLAFNRDCASSLTMPVPMTPNPNSNSVPRKHFKNSSNLEIPPSPRSATSGKSVSPSPNSAPTLNQNISDDAICIHDNNGNINNIVHKNDSPSMSHNGEIFNRIEKEIKKANRIQRTLSNASGSGSYLKTPVPGSFKHSPMILEEKQTDLLYDIEPEMEVFSLDEIETSQDTYDDDMDNDERDISGHDEKKEDIYYDQNDHGLDMDDMNKFKFKDDDDDEDDDEGMEYLAYNNAKSNTPPHFRDNPSGDLDVIISAGIEEDGYVEADISNLAEPESPSTTDDDASVS